MLNILKKHFDFILYKNCCKIWTEQNQKKLQENGSKEENAWVEVELGIKKYQTANFFTSNRFETRLDNHKKATIILY